MLCARCGHALCGDRATAGENATDVPGTPPAPRAAHANPHTGVKLAAAARARSSPRCGGLELGAGRHNRKASAKFRASRACAKSSTEDHEAANRTKRARDHDVGVDRAGTGRLERPLRYRRVEVSQGEGKS